MVRQADGGGPWSPYAFSPIDLIPDLIPVVGMLDDLLVVPLGVVLVRSMVPADVMEDCRVRAEAASANGRPVLWAAAVVVVAVWAGGWGVRLPAVLGRPVVVRR